MNNKLLKILNPLLFLALVITIVAMVLYRVPGRYQYDADTVGKIHEIAGIVFSILALCHIYLNWQWIKSQIFGIKAKKKK
jgi:uncharacterized membrane protein YozB (DUF420 family)